MISDGIFSSEIRRLEAAYNWRLPSPEIWRNELAKKNYTDSDFTLAITKIIYSGGFKFPTLGELDKQCNEAAIDRREREAAKQKLEENKYCNLSHDDILDKGKNKVIAKAFIDLLREYLHGRMSRKEWLEKQKALSISIFGKYEAILDRELAKIV